MTSPAPSWPPTIGNWRMPSSVAVAGSIARSPVTRCSSECHRPDPMSFTRTSPAFAGAGERVSEVYDTAFTGPGGDVPVRVYTPAEVDTSAPLPCLVYYHGGGWVIGDLDGLDAICRATANRGGCKVVSVDYRMAPE